MTKDTAHKIQQELIKLFQSFPEASYMLIIDRGEDNEEDNENFFISGNSCARCIVEMLEEWIESNNIQHIDPLSELDETATRH